MIMTVQELEKKQEEDKQVKVLFLRIPAGLHERIQAAAERFDPTRQRNATRMIKAVLEKEFPKAD